LLDCLLTAKTSKQASKQGFACLSASLSLSELPLSEILLEKVVTARLFKRVLINTQFGSIEPFFMKFCKFDKENDVGGWLQAAQEISFSDISVARRSHKDWVPRVCAMNLQESAGEAASARVRNEPIRCHTSGGSLQRKGS